MDGDDDLAAAIALSMAAGGGGGSAGAGSASASAEPLSADGFATIDPMLPHGFTGSYELFAVVTHKGRSADSGHYMGWVRRSGGEWDCVRCSRVERTVVAQV